jgi:hypothetical protein
MLANDNLKMVDADVVGSFIFLLFPVHGVNFTRLLEKC